MNMFVAIIVSALVMTVIVGGRYILTSGFFAWLTQRVKPGQYDRLKPQISREIRWSLYSAAIYGVPAGIVAWGWQNAGWTEIYMQLDAWSLWYLPVSLLLYLILHDSWFYWTHRLFHRRGWFEWAHAVHHESRPPTAWAAMSFHPIEALSGAFVIPLLVFIIPIHVSILALVLLVMTIMGVTNHMGWELFPRWLVHGPLGKSLITASHHERHHSAYRGNYGLYFRFWDKVCGTDLGLGSFDDHPAQRSGR
ncbi:MAG: sterol desaturase family protein [Parasphingorhabdus sp.]|uniref:sterol desaturase family protein n=1 Tax=Parasphingorhabdus sp. TaxID=2709688 RepID=UPI0032995AE3